MNPKVYIVLSGIVFLIIAVLHALRLLLGWDAVIAGWQAPQAVSGVAVLFFGWLALTAFRFR